MALFDAGRVLGGNFATILALFGAELRRRQGFATEMALFDAGRVLGGNFATILTLFGAEMVPGVNFATEMALFGAEIVLWPTGSEGTGIIGSCRGGVAGTLPNCREN